MLYRVLKNGNLVAIVLKFAPNFAFVSCVVYIRMMTLLAPIFFLLFYIYIQYTINK